MDEQHAYLQQLLEVTETILEAAKKIHSKMEDNDEQKLVELQSLFDQRQEEIDRLEASKNEAGFSWTAKGKEMVEKLQETERQLHPLMTGLQEAFASQMNRISQTKQMSQKYRGAYQNSPTDGTLFDTRK